MGFSSTFMPEAFAENEHLYVSAEVEGAFAKGQVVEIVVAEAGVSELDQAYGMPDVSVNGSSLYMAQAVDGAWYAYIVDGDYSDQIDAKYPNHDGDGGGADYGTKCGPTTNISYEAGTGTTVSPHLKTAEVQGIWLPFKLGALTTSTTFGDGDGSYDAGETIVDCAPTNLLWAVGKALGVNATTNAANNVVREGPALSNGTTANDYGNIKLAPNAWPFIQMLDFSPDGNVDIVYNRAGADETVTLVYTDGAQGLSFDKDIYGLHHEVGVTLTDWNLNIDPTDEDSWTFATLPTNSSAFYQMFDENGGDDTAGEEPPLLAVLVTPTCGHQILEQ